MWRVPPPSTGLSIVLAVALAFGIVSTATAERASTSASRLPDTEIWAVKIDGRSRAALKPGRLARLRAAGVNSLVVLKAQRLTRMQLRRVRSASRRSRLRLFLPVADRPGVCRRRKGSRGSCAVVARSLRSVARLARNPAVDLVVVRVRRPGTVAALHGRSYADRILALVPLRTSRAVESRAWAAAIDAAHREPSVDLAVAPRAKSGPGLDAFLRQLRRRKGVDLQTPSRPIPRLVSASKTNVSLSWTAARDNVGVRAYRLLRNDAVVGIARGRTHSFTSLRCGAAYAFGVQAVDAAGNRSAVAWLPGRTAPCEQPDGPRPPSPLPPPSGPASYVSPSGSDSNPGTFAAPWRTVQKAINVLGPGQVAYVRAGTYGQTRCNSGDGGSAGGGYVTIAAYPGERPVLAGSFDGILNISCAYLRVQGFLIDGPSVVGGTNVYASGGSHHVELVGNEIRNSVCQGVGVEPSAHHWAIVRNRIHDNGHGCDQQAHGIYLQGDDQLVADNVIYNHGEGFGIQAYPNGHRNLIVQNTIVNSGRGGIVVGGGNYDQAKIVNNVLAFNSGYGLHWNQSKPTNCLVARNLAYGNQAGGIEPGAPASCTVRDTLAADPLFVNLLGIDLHVLPGSPAVDSADPGYVYGPDHDGNPRPLGANADVGAYER